MAESDLDERTPRGDPGWFATTHWSVVRSAAQTGTPAAEAALENLCRVYWPPILVYVRSRGYSIEDAQDLTQAFFLRILGQGFVARVAQERGRFRSFLLKSLNNYLVNEWQRATSLKRGGGRTFISWEEMNENAWTELEPAAGLTPEMIYEKRWALTLFDRALARLRVEFAASAKSELFERLKVFLAEEPREGEYAAVGAELGLASGTVAVTVHRLRQRYRELLRDEIANTVETPEEIDEELRHLIELMAA